jgi:peptide/nickel transport system permease protein
LEILFGFALALVSSFRFPLFGDVRGLGYRDANMIIYELEADYSQYLESLGAPRRLIRSYAFRNAILPQITGLALQMGTIAAGAVVTETVFSYPGIGSLIVQAIQNQDYFLIQGCFLFIIIGVLLANFIVDIVYLIVDPRTRRGMIGEI